LDVLAAVPALRALALRRWFPQGLVLLLVVPLLGLITAGFIGTPVGNRNGLVVFVWILWWCLLMMLLVPFASRAWCGACPIPAFGDWLQRRTLLGVRAGSGTGERRRHEILIGRSRYFGLARRWPRALSNLWLQNVGFLLLATVSAVLLTSALATAIALLAMVIAATATAAVFRQRSFCRFLCPVGGFLSLYAKAAPLALRSKEASVCIACRTKSCVTGNELGWGCPWLEYPGRLERNNACGMCLECLKTCPHENLSLFLRRPFSERELVGLDEAWKAYLMVALAVVYSFVYLGPWGWLKDAANVVESGDPARFVAYAVAVCAISAGLVPGAFLGAAWLGRRLCMSAIGVRELALAGAAALVPFGLLAWIAFSVPLVLANGSYVVAAASDPLGAGWNLLGTAGLPWIPVASQWSPWLQVGLVLAGQATGLHAGWLETRALARSDRRAVLAFAPTAVLVTAVALTLVWVYAG
jgi:polyferredoxin